jgi:hypothetical protein
MIVWVIGAVWMVGCMALIWEARRTPITPSDYANEPRTVTEARRQSSSIQCAQILI